MRARISSYVVSFGVGLMCVATTSGCRDEAPTAPGSITARTERVHTHQAQGMLASLAAFVGRVLDTPLGAQPRITPSLRIESPSTTGRVKADQPVTIRVRYAHFDNQPALRTPDAGATLGTQSQVLTEGFVQGHVHGYLQRLDATGAMPDVNATSFCVLERITERQGFHGVAEGECPGVPPGEYRLSAEFQTNSHTAILKDGPRATPTADILTIRVR